MTKDLDQDKAPEIRAIADLAQDAAGYYSEVILDLAQDVVGLPKHISVLIKRGKNPAIISVRELFDEWRTAPERRKGSAVVTTLESFIALVDRHKDASSAIFAETTWPNPKLTAVIDYHTMERTARFGDHRIVYPFPLTDELKAWVASNDKPMDQGNFAAFIEDRVADLASPNDAERIQLETQMKTHFAVPNHMIELSRGLAIRVAAEVKTITMLQSGEVDIAFREEHQNDKGEKITVPGLFMISVPAFIDGDPVRIPARLRYRLREGKLTWWYKLYQWEIEIRNRISDDLEKARRGTLLPAYEGRPE